MADDAAISALLAELASIAASPMTQEQRFQRATPVVSASGVGVSRLVQALQNPALAFNTNRARMFGVPVEGWLLAVSTAIDPPPAGVMELLDALRRSEAAAAMVAAGYRPGRDASGKLSWSK